MCSFVGAKVETATRVDGPPGLREGHIAVFDARLDGVFSGSPTHIVEELIAIVDVAPTARPRRAISGITLGPTEVDRRKARFVEYR